jgi:putative two-component system response regulator
MSQDRRPQDAFILVVDDDPASLLLLKRILTGEGYTNVQAVGDPAEALKLTREVEPDLMILDLHLPGLSGLGILEDWKARTSHKTFLPVLMITADVTSQAKSQALLLGVDDFLTKPFDTFVVVCRVRNLLRSRYFYLELQAEKRLLETRIDQRTEELRRAEMEMLERLGRAGEFRDDATGKHTQRVGELSYHIARRVGMSPAQCEVIRQAAQLHDLGKIAIPDEILLHPDRLSPEQFEVVKSHTTIGAEILSGGRSEIVRLAEQIALSHHEHWDGSGYPTGLAGDAIPLAARIVAVADFFDALSSDRPYRGALPPGEVRQAIRERSGAQFEPAVVSALFAYLEESGQARAPAAP